MIKISNLYKRYHNHHGSDWVLKDINLTIPTNVSVGLIGRNGAGKSTLLRLIGGMDTPDKGEIRRQCKVSWPIGLGGGFQGSMTGRQNVKFVARVHNHAKDTSEIIRKVEEFAEIGEAFDEPVKTYSSGMRARLQFGLSLAFDFDVYLSDEATAVGDRAFKAKAKKAFADRVSQASLIMVSHGEGILKDMCQAGIFLDRGEAVWYDDINDAIKAYHDAYNLSQGKPKAAKKASPNPKKTSQSPLDLSKQEAKDLAEKIAELKKSELEPGKSHEVSQEVKVLTEKLAVHQNVIEQLEKLEGKDGDPKHKASTQLS
ncbi:ABC transporter ATP-binding protein [Salinicola peritrichatus]|uniref:ABC transporter ATP-binding protein n=1 Tax=Salinicola peritrichatus TaxID=1267424 RepID=UPI000DA14767|nr:ABC transporter ATP-binding protein [Salinicola peritrichatus]